MLTAIFAVVGLVIATGIRRFARRPRTVWLRTTVVLTVLSFVPDLLVDAAVSTKLLLRATHVVAAAIVIPAVARRLAQDPAHQARRSVAGPARLVTRPVGGW